MESRKTRSCRVTRVRPADGVPDVGCCSSDDGARERPATREPAGAAGRGRAGRPTRHAPVYSREMLIHVLINVWISVRDTSRWGVGGSHELAEAGVQTCLCSRQWRFWQAAVQ